MKRSYVVISFVILITACKKTDTTNAGIAIQTNIANVAYGTDPAQVMDVYLPPNRSTSSTKVIALIHGGNWASGDKSDLNAYVDTLQRRLPNYAIFNINYRLAGTGINLFPVQENDVKAAIEFIYSKRAEYAISEKFALFGESAGAHLALMQAYNDTIPIKTEVVIDYFGPADMTAMYNNPAVPGAEIAIANVMGTTPSQDSLFYAQNSPINFITHASSSTIIFHGDADIIVRHDQSDSLNARLFSAGVPSFEKVYEGQNNNFVTDTLSNSFDLMQTFLVAHMQ